MDDRYTTGLSESLVDELVGAVGLPKNKFLHNLAWRVFNKLTNRVASLGITFDHHVKEVDLPHASEWLVSQFCNPVHAHFAGSIPDNGPLLVVSNHPGAYDALVIFSQLNRNDIHWVSSEIPFLEKLINLRPHIIFASRKDPYNGMTVMRSAIRHLRSGGVLLYFGAGHRDPDPAVYPDAGYMIDHWLKGIETFIKYVPGLVILPTIVSGVVSKKWSQHPITFLRKKQIDKQRLSEFGQVITQLLKPGKLMLSPAISFGPAIAASRLLEYKGDKPLLNEIIDSEKILLIEHCERFGGDPGL